MPNNSQEHAAAQPHTRCTDAHQLLRRRSVITIILVLLAATCGVSIVTACGGWWGTRESVRFNSVMTEREMSRLPPISAYPDEEEVDYDSEDYDYEAAQAAGKRRTAEVYGTWHRAVAAEARGDFAETRRSLKEYLAVTERVDDLAWSGDAASRENIQANRNATHDRLDALASLDKGAPASAITAYLAARAAYDNAVVAVEKEHKTARTSPQLLPPTTDRAGHAFDSLASALTHDGVRALETAGRDRRLADNCLYLRAAIRYRAGDYTTAATLFDSIERKHPRSEKLDAARFMAGLAWMKASGSYNGYSAVGTEACPECQNAEWSRARDALTRLTREHPRSRFASDARGWLAYLFLRVGLTAEGLAEYYRLLAVEENKEERAKTLLSLRMVRPRATPADIERVERLLADEPRAALVYLYHNTYNYTVHIKDWDWSAGVRQPVTEQRTELERTARYASEILRRHPRTRIRGDFALRLAEIRLELDDHAAALDFANQALRLGVTGDLRVEALWVKGIAEHRLAKFDEARGTLQRLVTEHPQHNLVEGARRHLAMVAEDAGDLDAALEHYFALDYQHDIAYFVDVLMTPADLTRFIERHPHHNKINELRYALGVRHMRDRRWTEARDAYARVRTRRTSGYSGSSYGSQSKEPDEDDTEGVNPQWILRDMKTIDDLENLEQRVAAATDRETKAEALYQLASYQYQADSLLFYNPAAWQGGRQSALAYTHDDDSYRAPNEARILWNHMRDHSTRARALLIYLQIARDYKDTRAAPDALYTAAVCYERLDHGYTWLDLRNSELYEGERPITYADVRRAYPRYQLPRGTFGWEPATRTVNGKTGWSPKPKPAPRLSKFERGQRKAWAVYDTAFRRTADVWHSYVRPPLIALGDWLLIGFTLAGVVAASRTARRARALWWVQSVNRESSPLALWGERAYSRHRKFRQRARRALGWKHLEARDAVQLYVAASARFLVRRGRRALPRLASRSWRALCDRQTRRLIAFNAATHAALAVLLAALWRLL